MSQGKAAISNHESESAVPSPLEDLYARHSALAGRLVQRGDPVRAASVCLGMLDKFTPRPTSAPLRLLVEGVLRLLLHPAQEGPPGLLRQRLLRDTIIREQCSRALRRYLAFSRLDGDQRLLAEQAQKALAAMAKDAHLATSEPAWPPIPGIARVAYVPIEQHGPAQCRRLYVRPDEAGDFSHPTVGTLCPGRGVEAARSYLEAAGAEPIGGHAIEILIEGWFDEVCGESFALPLAVALISAHLGTALPDDIALTGALSLTGEPRPDGSDILVLPVDEIARKCEAALAAGCRRIYVPEHLEPGAAFCEQLAERGCQVIPVATLAEVLRQLFPDHAAAATPVLATPREMWRALAVRDSQPPTRLQWVSALTTGAIVFERGFVGEYLVRPQYAPFAVGFGANLLAALLVGTATWHLVDLPRRLTSSHPLPRWSTAASATAMACGAAWGLFQIFLPPMLHLPPPPHNQLVEHRSFQTFKDLAAYAFFTSLFVLSPAYMLQSAHRLEKSGRRRWALELVAGRLGRGVAGPAADPRTLTIIAACGIAAMLPFDIISTLPRSMRYGSDSPWHTIHIQVRDVGLAVAAAGFIVWFAKGIAKWLRR
jgi:hypothetical protein